MILEMDVGNTRAKWRLLDAAGERVKTGSLALSDSTSLSGFAEEITDVNRVRVASVAGDDSNQRLSSWLQSFCGVVPEFASTSAACAGVTNSYAEPERMGVDRWLAMLAAYREIGDNLLVVDAGSALTMDFVAADGRHLGGYIVPGRGLMEAALQGDTGRVRFTEPDEGSWRVPGRSTAEAVKRGVKIALCGALGQALKVAESRFREGYTVVLAGGDAGLVEDMPELGDITVLERPELVLDGLVLALG